MKWERIANAAAIIAAAMLFSVIVALARTPIALTPPFVAVKAELKTPWAQGFLAPSEAILSLGRADDALKKLVAEQRCLADVIYLEARGESDQRAIAEVILHRLSQGAHGYTICGVVHEGAGQSFCQFTFVCDGSLDRPRLPKAWRSSQVLAARVLAGEGWKRAAPMAQPLFTL